MNHTDFKKLYDGKFYNYDNSYGPECIDLFKGYYRDVKGYVIPVALGTAHNYWKNITKTGLIKTIDPKEGDAVFSEYIQSGVSLGHVGIFERFATFGGIKGWYQFDQLGNGAAVGGESPCKSRFYPFSKLYGYATMTDDIEARRQRFIKKYGLKQPSKTESYSQEDTCTILSKMDETNH